MNPYNKQTEIIPVIYHVSLEQVMLNVKTCKEVGIKKVFLINHYGDNNELIDIAKTVKLVHPDLWVGLNCLGWSTSYVLSNEELNQFDGLWCDESIPVEYYKSRIFEGLAFVGLAFKYQPQPKDLKLASEESILTSDVSCTSGPGTGQEADLDKILLLKEYLGDHPMAIASGVSIDNISKYNGIVEYVLVASSITNKGEIINKEKLEELFEQNRRLNLLIS